MSWTTISIDTPEELKDAIIGEFSADGILGVWERPLEGCEWVELILYFDPNQVPPLIETRTRSVFERNGHSMPALTFGTQEREDWIEEWRKGFTRFSIGERFEVRPTWESTGSRDPNRIQIEIDPGLAFGTGTHESTQLMLELLEQQELPPEQLCDLGTGSGILTIAAEKLGFRVEVACDLDPDAVRVALDNFDRNGVHVPVFIGSIEALAPSSVELLLANLTSEAIVDALRDIRRVLVPKGQAILSGVLESQVESLRQTLRAEGFQIDTELQRGEWMALKVFGHGG